jgi:hypothetical protein
MIPHQLTRFHRSVRHRDSEPCRNCGTAYIGNFCPQCGQEAHTGAPTTWGFIYEFLTTNVLERGKLPRTLWHLLRYPGGLTVDFLEGRRTRFIRPIRLYFTLSIIYFLILSLDSNNILKSFSADESAPASSAAHAVKAADAVHAANKPPPKTPGETRLQMPDAKHGPVIGAKQVSTPSTQEGDQDNVVLDEKGASKDANFESALPESGALGVFKKRMQRFATMPRHELYQTLWQGILGNAPKAMFFLVPVFAFLLKVLFIRRKIPYGAHLLFAFHYHALIFLSLLILLLPLPDNVAPVIAILVCLYLPLALHTTYACTWPGALWRSFIIGWLYPVAIISALFCAVAAALLL